MILNIERTSLAFLNLPLRIEIYFMFGLIGMISLIYASVISPIIFNYFLIPRIERRFGRYFEYDPLYRYIFLSKWMVPQNEVSLYIVKIYFDWKLKGEEGLPQKYNRYALKKIGYTINMATKFEIIMSFLYVFCMVVFCVSGIVVLIASGQLALFAHT